MDNQRLADLLFPGEDKTPDYYEEKFPYRDLPAKAHVTRMAPSPTGFIHLGNLYSALADERIAHRNGGVFYLRIEDTDEKRKVDGAVETIINVLRYFNIEFDEGAGFLRCREAYSKLRTDLGYSLKQLGETYIAFRTLPSV